MSYLEVLTEDIRSVKMSIVARMEYREFVRAISPSNTSSIHCSSATF